MKAIFIDKDDFGLLNGAEYDILARDDVDNYRVVDRFGDDYLYAVSSFSLVDGDESQLPSDDEYWQSIRDSERVRTFLKDIMPGMPMEEFEALAFKAGLTENEYLVCRDYIRQ
jgi:hypothetical protein